MRMQRAMVGILAAAALVALSTTTLAGGFAVVRLDESPGEVLVGTPWRFGFMVRQHDVTPTSDVTPVVRAVHKETGAEVTATGQQTGPVGHFEAEITFPHAGEWKWSINPEPFAETSFETLTVIEKWDALSYTASIVAGSCAAPGEVVFPLGDVEARPLTVKSSRLPVAVGSATIDTPLAELVTTGYAIGIGSGEAEEASIACADVERVASDVEPELVVGLQGWSNANVAGVAVLRDEGERTAVTLYLLNVDEGDVQPAASAETIAIEIAGETTNSWFFQPASLAVPAGTTIEWVNDSDAAHTVTGDDLAFDDSGLLEPGQSFRQTFAEPGSYHYRCAPHPWMEGVVVVE